MKNPVTVFAIILLKTRGFVLRVSCSHSGFDLKLPEKPEDVN